MNAPAIRLATAADVPVLVDVELDAGRMFVDVGMAELADDLPDRDDVGGAVAAGTVWVAELDGKVHGYVRASELDGRAHVDQVSVRPAYGRRGTGRRLVARVSTWGQEQGLVGTTLTTFRDVDFNGPYYARLGFRELAEDERGPGLVAVMEHEATIPGLDSSRRCAMLRLP